MLPGAEISLWERQARYNVTMDGVLLYFRVTSISWRNIRSYLDAGKQVNVVIEVSLQPYTLHKSLRAHLYIYFSYIYIHCCADSKRMQPPRHKPSPPVSVYYPELHMLITHARR
jgi:hypothetical protein